jgi:diguanylate cyclase (GGDEF)-like protein
MLLKWWSGNGGEEFVYTLLESDSHTAFSVAENARIAIEQLRILHKESKAAAFVTISLGIASIVSEQSINPSFLTRCADQALYQAKKNGRNG